MIFDTLTAIDASAITVSVIDASALTIPALAEYAWTQHVWSLTESTIAWFGLEALVDSATGWVGMGLIFVYSFLIAFVLPGPSEIVLAAPINLGAPAWAELAGIMLVSAVGKAAGSVVAFHIGQEVKQSGPVVRWLRRSRFDVLAWSERRSVQLAKRYGYGGLAIALSVPFFPDTISIYAFAVLEKDYPRFAVATFLGSLGRLVVTLGVLDVLFILF